SNAPYVGGWAEWQPAGDDGEVVWWSSEDGAATVGLTWSGEVQLWCGFGGGGGAWWRVVWWIE
nr:hypothetical protein [Tanacetum cinerariifolium]